MTGPGFTAVDLNGFCRVPVLGLLTHLLFAFETGSHYAVQSFFLYYSTLTPALVARWPWRSQVHSIPNFSTHAQLWFFWWWLLQRTHCGSHLPTVSCPFCCCSGEWPEQSWDRGDLEALSGGAEVATDLQKDMGLPILLLGPNVAWQAQLWLLKVSEAHFQAVIHLVRSSVAVPVPGGG